MKISKIDKRHQLFLLMVVSTCFALALTVFRLNYIGFPLSKMNSVKEIVMYRSPTFMFIVWNLFLAWIPYFLALILKPLHTIMKSKIVFGLILAVWLLFLPNAPYIITDLMHIHYQPPVPLWFDVLLFNTFAWTGMMVGFLSIFEVENFLKNELKFKFINPVIMSVLMLTGFGVYVGRFQRWNSWDMFSRPTVVLKEISNVLIHPMQHLNTFGLAIVISVFLIIGYWFMKILMRTECQN